MKVKITKFHPLVSHDVDDEVEFEDSFAEKHIADGYAELAEGNETASKGSASGKSKSKEKAEDDKDNSGGDPPADQK